MNVAIILAAGNSKRFNQGTPKQLYTVDGKPVINHSIDVISEYISDIIIVTNSDCKQKISTDCKIVVNDVDNRLTSIKKAVDSIKNNNYQNILIHDSARPFITSQHIESLIVHSQKNYHTQYYLQLVNGLATKIGPHWQVANREDFIELVTPQITDFETFKYIFYNYINIGLECEILPAISKLNLDYQLLKGENRWLRKITTIDDIY